MTTDPGTDPYHTRRHYNAAMALLARAEASLRRGAKTPQQVISLLSDALLLQAEALDQNMSRTEMRHRLEQHPLNTV